MKLVKIDCGCIGVPQAKEILILDATKCTVGDNFLSIVYAEEATYEVLSEKEFTFFREDARDERFNDKAAIKRLDEIVQFAKDLQNEAWRKP